MKENSIGDRIEEKYTRYINCETDILELTIEEAIFILEKDVSVHYVEDLLQEAYKVILSDYKRVLKENEMYKRNSEIMSKENLSTAEQLKVEIKENFRLKNQLENNRKEYQETYKDIKEELKELKKENEELKNEVMEKDLKIIGTEEYTKASMKEIIAQYYTANEDCIPKSKIKDIINRMDYDIKKTKEIISNNSNIYTSDRRNDYQIVRLRAMNTKSLDIKKRLQELIEGRK